MSFGWMGKILDVNLTSGAITTRDTMTYARDYIGGRSLASKIAWDEIAATTQVYDADNRVIIATGPLTGTLAPTSGRTVMSSLSPRAYPKPWYMHSTIGGWFGSALKYAGYDGIVVHGRSAQPVYLEISNGKARLMPAADLWGRDARETQLVLIKKLGQRAQVLAIGPAGENLVRFASVQHAEENAAGHSGFGAVWGSKKLKAIAVVGEGAVSVADPHALLDEVLRAGKFKTTPSRSALSPKERLTKRRPVCSQACTFNCLVADYGEAADGRRLVGHCIGLYPYLTSTGADGTRYSGGGVEVPAGVNFGKATDALLHQECNDLGLDLWFRLAMHPWFMRCQQLGVKAIRGFPIEPESASWFRAFMRQLAYREGLGAIFAEDLRRAMDELESELPEELVDLGRRLEFGFGFPAHREGRFWDEEPLPFWVVSAMMYASEPRDPTIGTHQGFLLHADFLLNGDPEAARRQFRRVSEKVWGFDDAFEPTFENKAPVAIWTQHQHMIIDSLPMCDFAFPQIIRPMDSAEEWYTTEQVVGDLDLDLRLMKAVTGVALSRDEINRVAERAFTLERLMLARAGRTRELEEALAPHFKLPCRADGTSIDEAGFARLLDEYYAARGWDLELGWPMPDLLQRLGLQQALPELMERRQQLARDRTTT